MPSFQYNNVKYTINKNGSMSYHRTQYGHGGKAYEHREEMRRIAAEVVNELTPQIAAAIYNESLSRLIGALQYDIETVVAVTLNSTDEIFRDQEFGYFSKIETSQVLTDI